MSQVLLVVLAQLLLLLVLVRFPGFDDHPGHPHGYPVEQLPSQLLQQCSSWQELLQQTREGWLQQQHTRGQATHHEPPTLQ